MSTASATPAPSVLRANLQLFAISVLSLYLELLLIRWVSTEVRIFAYLQNTVLVVCVLGLGMGCWTCRSAARVRDSLIPLAILAFLLGVPITRTGLGFISELLSGYADLGIWANMEFGGVVDILWRTLVGLGATFFLMAMLWEIFVPLGRILGQVMDDHPRIIEAYSVNVAGSLIGIWLFAGLSALDQVPLVWLGLAALLYLPFVGYRGEPKLINFALLACVVGFGALSKFDANTLDIRWSPYQKLATLEIKDEGQPDKSYRIAVNNTGYQEIYNLGAEHTAKHPEWFPPAQRGYSQYDIPTYLAAKKANVLIVGSGSGNDVAGALRNGAERVVAVEIDPLIIRMGKQMHPEKPYDSPKVVIVNDDARSYFANTSEKFDLIIFGLLDSHTTTAMTNARLDHYVYTRESIERVKTLLNPGGLVVLSFQVDAPYIGDRINRTLRETFEQEPIVFPVKNSHYGWGGMLFVVGNVAGAQAKIDGDAKLKPLIADWREHSPIKLGSPFEVATDDWPYLYLRGRMIPVLFYMLALLLAGVYYRGLWQFKQPDLLRGWGMQHWHFFFLGAAFMLLEVQNISKAAVVLGNTWQVNAVMISAILLLVLVANAVAAWLPRLPIVPVYALLIGSCVGLYFVDVSRFAFLPYASKAAIVGLVLSFPMFFSGIVFIRSFAGCAGKDRALGANLFGALIGGILQSVTFITGIKALLIVVACLYLAAFLTRPRVAAEQA